MALLIVLTIPVTVMMIVVFGGLVALLLILAACCIAIAAMSFIAYDTATAKRTKI